MSGKIQIKVVVTSCQQFWQNAKAYHSILIIKQVNGLKETGVTNHVGKKIIGAAWLQHLFRGKDLLNVTQVRTDFQKEGIHLASDASGLRSVALTHTIKLMAGNQLNIDQAKDENRERGNQQEVKS